MARRPAAPWNQWRQGGYWLPPNPNQRQEGFWYVNGNFRPPPPPPIPQPMFRPPAPAFFYQQFPAPANYGSVMNPQSNPYVYYPTSMPMPIYAKEDQDSDRIAFQLDGVRLNPPIYEQPRWQINPAAFQGPPRPTKSDDRRERTKPKIAFRCDKNSSLSLPNRPYFLGFVSPSANTVDDMENIPDLACSVWSDDSEETTSGMGSTSSSRTNAFDRECSHFDQLREKAVERGLIKLRGNR